MGCDYHHFVLKKDVKSKRAFSDSEREVNFDYVMLCCVESGIDTINWTLDHFCKNDIDEISKEFASFSFVSGDDCIKSFRESVGRGYTFPKTCKEDVMKWFALTVKDAVTGTNRMNEKTRRVLKNIKIKCIAEFRKLGIEKEIFYDSNGRSCHRAGILEDDAFFAFAITC